MYRALSLRLRLLKQLCLVGAGEVPLERAAHSPYLPPRLDLLFFFALALPGPAGAGASPAGPTLLAAGELLPVAAPRRERRDRRANEGRAGRSGSVLPRLPLLAADGPPFGLWWSSATPDECVGYAVTQRASLATSITKLVVVPAMRRRGTLWTARLAPRKLVEGGGAASAWPAQGAPFSSV